MIGSKKLSTIREELHRAVTTSGDDPIRWLEERLSASEHGAQESEVLQSLQRVLEAMRSKKKRRQRVGPKR